MLPNLLEVYDEPFADSSALPSLLLNKIAKQDVTVALSGDGGDESFLGYNHFDWFKKFNYDFLALFRNDLTQSTSNGNYIIFCEFLKQF